MPNEADTRGFALLYGSDQIYQTEIGTTVITIFHTILYCACQPLTALRRAYWLSLKTTVLTKVGNPHSASCEWAMSSQTNTIIQTTTDTLNNNDRTCCFERGSETNGSENICISSLSAMDEMDFKKKTEVNVLGKSYTKIWLDFVGSRESR